MRVGLLVVGAPGHAYPMSTLARRLKARGRDVVLISIPYAEPLVRAAELPFVPYCEKEYPAGSVREIFNRLSKLQGQEAVEFTSRAVANTVQAAFRDLPQTLRETRADAVVFDVVQLALG